MTDAQQGTSVSDLLANMAKSNVGNFALYFARLRKMFPEEVAEACLGFIATHELDPAARSMALWLSSQGKYVDILFESDRIQPDVARKALSVLKTVDPLFAINFLRASDRISSPRAILRALSVVPGLGDYSVLIPWLRRLSNHPDEHVRSRSVKLFCELRPSQSLIERQMLSDDPRVRANAIEAMWHSSAPNATELFKTALCDEHHRVVGNALVGLHLQGDSSALDKMQELSKSADPLFRAAMAWCLGFIRDVRAIPTLEVLSKDESAPVRKVAVQSLLALQQPDMAEK
jgi:HEAT repeat protein